MKYKCKDCLREFDDSSFNKNSSSILVRSLVFNCPYCPLGEIELTDQSKLMLERKTKIIKIENDQQTG